MKKRVFGAVIAFLLVAGYPWMRDYIEAVQWAWTLIVAGGAPQ